MAERRLLVIGSDDELVRSLAASPGLSECVVETCRTDAEALRRLSRRAYAVLITNTQTRIEEDLELIAHLRSARPGVKAIVLAPERSPEEVLAALRAHVFACFCAPFDVDDVATMAQRALFADDWREGIEVISARPDWIALRVSCRMLDAERLVHFMGELRTDLEDSPRDQLLTAFREVLINAMEHGAGFDPEKVIQVSAVRTERAIVYHFRDPGPGFSLEEIPHAAMSNPPDDPMAHMAHREAAGLRPGGFGLLIASRVVDEMLFNETGNEVLLIKHTT